MTATTIESKVAERMDREASELAEKLDSAGREHAAAIEAYRLADAAMREQADLILGAAEERNNLLVSTETREQADTAIREATRALHAVAAKGDVIVRLRDKVRLLDSPEERERRVEQASQLAEMRAEGRKPSAKQVAVAALLREGSAMHYRDVTRAVQESGLVELKGETPEATVNAMLAVAAKKGETFTKVAPGVFDLLDREAARASLRADLSAGEAEEAQATGAAVEASLEADPPKRDRSAAAKKAAETRKRKAAEKATA